jgi:acetamidase/formamidase
MQSRIHRFEPNIYYYTFGPNKPALSVRSGDSIIVKTRDAGGSNERSEPMPEELKQKNDFTILRQSNPLVGPIYVEDAHQGRTGGVYSRNRSTAM